MNIKAHTEKHCVFFLVPLIVGCAIVAAVVCEGIHLLMVATSRMPLGEHWPVYLGVGAGVAAVVALLGYWSHRRDAHASLAPSMHS
jgi:multidrug transporter EmrE-like cation transporter